MKMENNKTSYKAAKLASYVEGELIGDPHKLIRGVCGINECEADYLTFAENKKRLKDAEKSRAGLVIVAENVNDSCKDILKVANPRLAYAKISCLFQLRPYFKPGVHLSSVVSDSAQLGENVSIHPHVVIDDQAEIGDNVILAPGVYVGESVKIGANSIIHPGVVIEYNCEIGENVIIHAGTIIGGDGYGYVRNEDGHHKIAQLGNVIIKDNVEIGSNVTIDRATSGSTIIGTGSKIDNLVQIAHNVKIGRDCLVIAQTGIAGSSRLQQDVILAGQVGVVDHIKIGSGTKVASKSLITKDIPEGSYYSGNPAQNHFWELKEQAACRRLPRLAKKIEELERRIKKLEGEID